MIRLTKVLAILFYVLSTIPALSQSSQHPVIWITPGERNQILEDINKYDWAKSIVDQLHSRVDDILATHQSNPNAILELIPAFSENDQENNEFECAPQAYGHRKVLTLAFEAGMLYYLTEDETYAQFSADILAAYIKVIAPRTPETTSMCGFVFFDARFTYPYFALAYDFIYNYLKKPGLTVYDKESGRQVPFDNSKAQKAIANMVGNVLQEYGEPDTHGMVISNHPILTAPGALYGLLCIEDKVERERLFDVFWEKGTAHQNSFKNTILPMFGEQGIWPESTSYSFMPKITMFLNIVDRIYPEMNVTADYKDILEGNFLFDNLRLPDRKFVRYGDSKRNSDGTRELYLYTLSIAERKGYADLKKRALVALKHDNSENYHEFPISWGNRSVPVLELFWSIPIPEKIDGSIDFQTPTVLIKHAGIALQRNYVEQNNELYGLCGIIGGATYVHSHCTGIAMELYGAGYVMAPNAGLPPTVQERRIPLHEHYFRLYAGNNTVIVNGTSHGLDEGSWKPKANVYQNTTVNIAAEPLHLEEPVSNQFSFATQFLKDEVNNCDQQRTLSVIRTSETTAYYFDMFRSKSLDENKFHDYIYHNIGDASLLTNSNDKVLEVKETDRYANDIGDVVFSPGWRFFENTRASSATSEAVKVRFDINFNNRYMHLFIPGGVEREYTKALAPPTREARNGYVDKKTPVLAIRQQGEAWERPYVVIFEPSVKTNPSVQRIESLMDEQKIVGAKVHSKVGDVVITDYIISQDKANAHYKNEKLNLQFKGRFGIVRKATSKGKTNVSLYIGEGETLEFEGHILNAGVDYTAFKTIK